MEIVFDRLGLIVEFKNVSISRSLSKEVEGVRPVEGDEPTKNVDKIKKYDPYLVIIIHSCYNIFMFYR